MEEKLSPAQKAQMANRIVELDQQIANLDSNLAKVEQQSLNVKGRKQQSLQAEAESLRKQRANLLQEANTLRAQLGLPLVIPAISQSPQVTQVIVKQEKRGGCLRNIFVVLGVFVLIIIVIASTNNEEKPTSTTTTSTSSSVQSQANIPTEKPSFKVGDDVKVDEVRWKLIEVKDEGQTLRSGNQFIEDKKTSGKFIRITFEMENLSKEMLSFVGIDLVDDQGREFKPLSDAFMFVPDEQSCPLIENLNPNVPKTCQLIFELPINAEKIWAKVGDLKMLGNAHELIDTGL